jgi:PAS domain S-box-containing protein
MVRATKQTKTTKRRGVTKRVTNKSRLSDQRIGQSQISTMGHERVEASLWADQDRGYNLFENVPISLWEEDFSAVKACIDDLRSQGVKDFRQYFDNNPEAVVCCVEMVRIIDVNQPTLALFKAKNKDELLRGLSQVFGKESYDVFKEQLITLAEGHTRFESERPMRTLRGRKKYIYLTLAIPPGFEDTWSRVLLSIIDITERKRAEEELKSSREYFKKQNDSLQEVIFTIKMPERIIAYVSRAVERVFGYEPDECVGKATEFLYPSKEEYSSFGNKLNNTIKEGKDVLFTEHLFRKRNGVIFPGEVTTTLLRENGKVTQVISILRDITTRKQGEEALRKSEARLAAAQRIAHVGNWDWDIVSNQLHWSDEIYRIFGLTPQQFGATYDAFLSYVHPEDRRFVERSVNEALYEAIPYSIDHRIVLPDGTVRVVHEEAEVALDEAGKPIRMMGTVHDITERKRAEDELRALSRELVETEEVERRSIGRELHDQIGQSLTALQLLLAKGAKLPQEGMQDSLSQAQSVVSELMAQVRQISLDLCPAMLDDLGLLPTLLWHFERFSTQTGVKVEFEHRGLNIRLAPNINLAAYRIVQEALTNVARHAGVSQVAVRAWVDEEALHVRVEDRGAGFDPDTRHPGTSSGLSGMRERALSAGGKVVIESTPNIGTTVTVEFPLSVTVGDKKAEQE